MDRKEVFRRNMRAAIRAARSRGITVRKLAEEIGKSESLIWKWMSKGAEFPEESIRRAAKILGIDVESLWNGAPPATQDSLPREGAAKADSPSPPDTDHAALARAALLLRSDQRDAVRRATQIIWDHFGQRPSE